MSALATAVAPSALDAYRREPLLVCALWQPWATLAAIADPETGEPPKAHETRHWAPRQATPFRVVIHATKTWNADCRAAVELEVFRSALKRIGFYPGDPRPFERRQITPPSGLQLLPLGALIAVATVLRVWGTGGPDDARGRGLTLEDLAFGNYWPDRFAWRLSDVVPLRTPIPFLGRQEPLYELTDYHRALVLEQLQAVDA
jgi:hypothetical protein